MLCSALSVMVNAGECSAAAPSLQPGPHPDSDSLSMRRAHFVTGTLVSSELSGLSGTSRAGVLNILQLRELFKGASYKGHSGQQLQHSGSVLDSQTL